MTTRTTQTIAKFTSPFLIPGFKVPQPAEEYRVNTDEELLGDTSLVAWHRVRAFVHLPATSESKLTRQLVPISSADLDATLQKDHKLS